MNVVCLVFLVCVAPPLSQPASECRILSSRCATVAESEEASFSKACAKAANCSEPRPGIFFVHQAVPAVPERKL